MNTEDKRLFTSQEAANYLSVSEHTLRVSRVNSQSERAGVLLGVKAPLFVRIGRSIRYKREDLDAWIDSNASRLI